MSEVRRSVGGLAMLAAGAIIGAVEVVLAVAFAALVFGGATPRHLGDGIGLYLVAACLDARIPGLESGEPRSRRQRPGRRDGRARDPGVEHGDQGLQPS